MLPDDALVPVPVGLVLDPARVAIDVVEFEAALGRGDLAGAIDLYRGPFLDGVVLAGAGAVEFERWAEEERAVLARSHRDALRTLAITARDVGDHTAGVRWAQAWATADPLAAPAAAALVGALVAAGDVSGAVRACRAHQVLVRAELGVEPDPSVAAALEPARSAVPLYKAGDGSRMLEPPCAPAEAFADSLPTPRATPAVGPYVGMPAPTISAEVDASPRTTAPVPAPSARERSPRWRADRTRGVVIGTAGVLFGAVLASAWAAGWQDDAADAGERSVVVAPFTNETGDTALAPLGRVTADWVAHGLGTSGIAEVVPTSATFAVARHVDSVSARQGVDRVRLFATESGARLVVSGRIYRVADSVQFRAQISDGRNGRLLRALEPVTAAADAPMPGVDRLRQRVLGALAPLLDERLAAWASRAGAPPSYAVYREFTEGIRFFTQADCRSALPHFVRAQAADTAYATALLWIAVCQGNLGQWSAVDSLTRALDRSRERLTAYDGAVLDNVRAWVTRDWAAAYEAAKRGAKLAPGSMEAVQVGVEALRLNRPREAIRVLERMDPARGELRGYWAYWFTLTEAYHRLGRYDDELDAARRARADAPDDPRPVGVEARALAALGRPAEALALIDTRLAMRWERGPAPEATMLGVARELVAHGHAAAADAAWQRVLTWLDARDTETRQSPGCRACRGQALAGLGRVAEAHTLFAALVAEDTARLVNLRDLGVVAARAGDRTRAERAAAQLANREDRETPTYLYWRALIAAQLGDHAGATELLREAIGRGLGFLENLPHTAPELQPLRGYPPFRALVEPKG
jgi:DNA-binding SARP family transcriptional activator/TolB-like protein